MLQHATWKRNDLCFQILALYKDGVLTQDVTPMKPNSGKRHISKTSVKGDELTIVR